MSRRSYSYSSDGELNKFQNFLQFPARKEQGKGKDGALSRQKRDAWAFVRMTSNSQRGGELLNSDTRLA